LILGGKKSTPVSVVHQDILLFLNKCRLCLGCLIALYKTLSLREPSIMNYSNEHCEICNGVRNNLNDFAKAIIQIIEAMNYEWQSFRIDVKIPTPNWSKKEPFLTIFSVLKDEYKKELKKTVGSRIEEWTGKIVSISNPDIIITIDKSGKIDVNSAALFIEGKYEKLVRWISQTKWLCRACFGTGCFECDGKGRYFCMSVEELITTPLKFLFETNNIKFHAGGREDVDVLVLSGGRPFVLEITNPLKRKMGVQEIQDWINSYSKNLIKVSAMSFTTHQRIAEIKKLTETSFKKYRGIVKFFRRVSEKEMKNASNKLKDVTITQRTPYRVMRRRADLLRYKKVQQIKLTPIGRNFAEFQIVCQGGTYVKEFISGDDGKTTPSLSEVLRTQCRCVELDLMDVYLQNDKV
jgi:tRNA pseudouridine synthase 10